MSTPSADSATGAEFSLAEQVMKDDMAALEQADTSRQGQADAAAQPSDASDKNGVGTDSQPQASEGDPNPPAPEGETGTGKPGEEAPKETPVPPPAEKPADPAATPETGKPAAPLKIGQQEFASVEAALAEATRVLGRNASLGGDLRVTNERLVNAESSVKDLKAQLEDAVKVNQQWVEWHKQTTAGEHAFAPGQDPESIAKRTVDELEARRTKSEQEIQVQKEITQIQSVANFSDTQEIILKVSDKINPLTERYFTPIEAYDFACRQLGLPNLLNDSSKNLVPSAPTPSTAPTAPPAKPEPVAGDQAKVISSSAARPSTSPARGGNPAPQKPAHDPVNDALREAFPLH